MHSAGKSEGYARAVPMVQRTVAVLERLTAHPEGATLTELSRAERISPSSLLALLTTLRARGYVTRGEADGRYRAGPALAALGSAAVAVLHHTDRPAIVVPGRRGRPAD